MKAKVIKVTRNNSPGRSRNKAAVSQKDEAYERVYQDIITFRLKPGERISEATLEQLYDIGKASVRTVLQRLVQEGLVENNGRHGHQVIPLTLESIRNVLELRLILEPAAAELAAGRVDAERLRKFNKHTGIDLSKSNWKVNARYLEANRDFHVAIAEYSGNAQLATWLKHLHNLSFRTFYLLERSGTLIAGGQESHEEIIRALESGNGDEAARLAREHMQSALDITLAAVLKLPELQQVNLR
jgi:DNA-binding GntR family transcriptional regulator